MPTVVSLSLNFSESKHAFNYDTSKALIDKPKKTYCHLKKSEHLRTTRLYRHPYDERFFRRLLIKVRQTVMKKSLILF